MTSTTVRAEDDLRHAARLQGVSNGTAWLLLTSFIGTAVVPMAADLRTATTAITLTATLAGAVGLGAMIWSTVRRVGVPSRWVTAGAFWSAAAGLIIVATARGALGVDIGMLPAGLPMWALSPVRSATAARFGGAGRRDGTFTARSRAWMYAALSVLGMAVGAIASLGPHAWRLATLALAAWVATLGAALASRQRHPAPTPRHERLVAWRLLDLLTDGGLRRRIGGLFCAGMLVQLCWQEIERELAGPGLLGSEAVRLMAVLPLVRLAAIPGVLHHGRMSDNAVRHSARLAAFWLVGSGAVVAVTEVAPGRLPAGVTILAITAGVGLVERGAGPTNDAARTYASRIAREADQLATIAQLLALGTGSLLASRLGWRDAVAAWTVTSGLAAYAAVRRSYHAASPDRLGVIGHTAGRDALAFSWLHADRRAGAVRIGFLLGGDRGSRGTVISGPGDRLVLVGSLIPDLPEGQTITLATVQLADGRPRSRARRPCQRGRLWPGARFPVLVDGQLVGRGRWWSWPGTWALGDDGNLELRSATLLRPHGWHLLKRNG
jgi:hypothetical protein